MILDALGDEKCVVLWSSSQTFCVSEIVPKRQVCLLLYHALVVYDQTLTTTCDMQYSEARRP